MSSTVADLIRSELGGGSIPFARFMELALYAPNAGYYVRKDRDPFGKSGDFYTAEQIQPVFGMLMSRLIRARLAEINARTIVELGPGRAEMSAAFDGLDYRPVEAGSHLPESFRGVVFANEFFDAHPVHLVKRSRGKWRELCVAGSGDGFVWAKRTRGPAADVAAYLDRYHPQAVEASVVEVNMEALKWVASVSAAIEQGCFIIIDYGYTAREYPRHSHGTLMSYHQHRALDEVLLEPGGRDITAHVAWTPLQDALVEHGWRIEAFTTLAMALLDIGAADEFASVFANCSDVEQKRRRMQLKTLLFGMGETFRVLIAARATQ